MPAQAYGQDTLTALVRAFVLPQITDNVYTKNNALLFRLVTNNKKKQKGGLHIEIPVLWNDDVVGGSFSGLDVLNAAPIDSVKNAILQWKQYYTGFVVDNGTLLRADSDLAIANMVQLAGQQARQKLADMIAKGIYQASASDPQGIDGLGDILGTANTYAGIDRSQTANAFWRAKVDAATTTLTFAAMRGLKSQATIGGEHPTIWLGSKANYNRLYALGTSTSGYAISMNREPAGYDEILLQAGFTNFIHENIPFVQDDNLPDTHLLAPNENHLGLIVSERGDFEVEPFQKPINQLAWVSHIHWAGNLYTTSPRLQAGFTNLQN